MTVSKDYIILLKTNTRKISSEIPVEINRARRKSSWIVCVAAKNAFYPRNWFAYTRIATRKPLYNLVSSNNTSKKR